MTTIAYNSEDIGTLYGPSLNRAFAELYAASHVRPVVRVPYGGKRTPAQQQQINPGQTVSDHVKGRAVDIWNWEEIQAHIGVTRFKEILRKWGWLNQQVNGAPFPREPWHYASHLNALQLLAVGIKVIVTPKPKPPEEEDQMTPRPYTTDGGKTFQIMLEDGRVKTLVDVNTGKLMNDAQVIALNLFLRYDKAYYPNGVRGAAVFKDAATQRLFSGAITPPAS